MIFFAALDLGRPPSKVNGSCGGIWSERTVWRTDRVEDRRRIDERIANPRDASARSVPAFEPHWYWTMAFLT
jgi:hypothetical protein